MKWEYKTEDYYCSTDEDLDEKLNREGQDGWEAISIDRGRGWSNITITFKRKIET